jgi:hypothetical protein
MDSNGTPIDHQAIARGQCRTPAALRGMVNESNHPPFIWPEGALKLSTTETYDDPIFPSNGQRRTPPDLRGMVNKSNHPPFIWPAPRNAEQEAEINAKGLKWAKKPERDPSMFQTPGSGLCSICGGNDHTQGHPRHQAKAAQGLAIRLKPTSDSRTFCPKQHTGSYLTNFTS